MLGVWRSAVVVRQWRGRLGAQLVRGLASETDDKSGEENNDGDHAVDDKAGDSRVVSEDELLEAVRRSRQVASSSPVVGLSRIPGVGEAQNHTKSSGRGSLGDPNAPRMPIGTSQEVRELVSRKTSGAPFSPGSVYDPLSITESTPIPLGEKQPFFGGRSSAGGPRPSRLERQGKEIHFMNLWFLSRFVSPFGNILPRRRTGLSAKKQRRLARYIKRAKAIGLMPYLTKYSPGLLDRAEGEQGRSHLCPPQPKDFELRENRRRN